jgi:signal transduction histidine kinase
MANGIAAVAYVVLNRALKSLITVSARPARLEVSDALIFLVYTISLYALDRWMTGDFKDVAKTSFVSAWVVLMSCLGARYCLQIHEQYGLKLARNFAYLYITVALLWLGRILAALGVQVTYAFDTALINTLIWVAIFITGIVKYMVFPLLLLQKTENDKQEQLRQSLVRANKTVTSSALSASIAHELNQPLAAMRINSQVLLKALEAQQKNAQAGGASLEMTSIVRDILQDNERASQIIVTLRSIFRQTPGATEAVDSALLIRKTLQLLGKEIERRQVQLELQWVDGVCIQIPEDELHQVLMNLIFNSLEALETRPAGQARILIQSARRGAQLEITVADNGPGVAAEIKDMLFEILSSNKTSGMGLGLWLCKFIVERHGGTITYQNSPLGGANFSILLPCHTSGSPSLASGQSIRPDHPIG